MILISLSGMGFFSGGCPILSCGQRKFTDQGDIAAENITHPRRLERGGSIKIQLLSAQMGRASATRVSDSVYDPVKFILRSAENPDQGSHSPRIYAHSSHSLPSGKTQ
jgi:hypothetical protein